MININIFYNATSQTHQHFFLRHLIKSINSFLNMVFSIEELYFEDGWLGFGMILLQESYPVIRKEMAGVLRGVSVGR